MKNLNIQILTWYAIRRKNIQSKIHVMILKDEKNLYFGFIYVNILVKKFV